MLLQKLTLENFQGLKSWAAELPGGCSASIYGDNATGKTTVYNALTWLLFDRASTGTKGFSPKPRGAEGEIHHLDSSVTGEFLMDDGKVVTFRKVFHEVWKKKRGAAEQTFSGHNTDYYLNGVPSNEKEYAQALLDYTGGTPEMAKILTMPEYFPQQMKWEDRRRILLEVCGDVSDEQVIASNKDLAELPEFLRMPGQTDQKYSIDEYRKVVTARRKEINQQLDIIPARIDEASKAMPDVAGLDYDSNNKAIAEAIRKIDVLTAQKAALSSGDTAIAQISKEIAEKKAEMADARARYQEQVTAKRQAQADKVADIRAKMLDLQFKQKGDQRELESLQKHLEDLEHQRDELLSMYQEAAAQKWDTESETCPTCGQKLPADQIAHMRALFNEKKSERLEALSKKGKTTCSKDMIEETEQKIAAVKKDLADVAAQLPERNEAFFEAQKEETTFPAYENTAEYEGFYSEIGQLMKKQTDAMGASSEATSGIDSEIKSLREQISASQENLVKLASAEGTKNRISALKAQQRKLSAEFDRTEKGLYLSDLFVKTKVKMLTDQINEKFKTVSFQLFVDQINGGVKECCEVLVPGEGGRMIPYAYANNAARINAGLEIIGTLSKHWKLHMPVIVDNAEAITHMEAPDTQVIRLVVSEPDKVLRLEFAK